MSRIKGSKDLPEAKRGALIEVYKTSDLFNRQLAKRYDCNKKTVANVIQRAEQAEKENIDLLSLEAHKRRL